MKNEYAAWGAFAVLVQDSEIETALTVEATLEYSGKEGRKCASSQARSWAKSRVGRRYQIVEYRA